MYEHVHPNQQHAEGGRGGWLPELQSPGKSTTLDASAPSQVTPFNVAPFNVIGHWNTVCMDGNGESNLAAEAPGAGVSAATILGSGAEAVAGSCLSVEDLVAGAGSLELAADSAGL